MRFVIFAAGLLIAALGLAAFRETKDPTLLQGGLTLGGGFIICGIFSIKALWHGVVGAGVLALLGLVRTLPNLGTEPKTFHPVAAMACGIVLVTTVKALLAERARRSVEKLKSE